MVTLPRLVFLLALVDHDVACKVERNGGAIQGDRCRPSDIGPIQQKIAAMTGTFKALLERVPDGRTSQMGTNGNEGIQTFSIANHPYPLGFLKAGTHFSNLIVLWFPCLKLWRGFIQDPGKEEPYCR